MSNNYSETRLGIAALLLQSMISKTTTEQDAPTEEECIALSLSLADKLICAEEKREEPDSAEDSLRDVAQEALDLLEEEYDDNPTSKKGDLIRRLSKALKA